MADEQTRPASLGELATFFLRLGFTAFGGPAAHIAMMEETVVRQRRWITREEFLDLIGAANLIPGPNSTELAIHIGYAKQRWRGLLVAGLCFILPAALLTGIIAWAYVRMGKLPQFAGSLAGVKAVVIAVVVQALWALTRTAVKTPLLAAVGVASTLLVLLGVGELAVLAAGGLFVLGTAFVRRGRALPLAGLALPAAVSAMAETAPAALPIFLVFAKIGSVLYGSGYVLLAFLRTELVERRHWLTEAQLLDAVAVGQITPGPVFSTATFVGYLLGRAPGAAAATAGIFAPAFFFVAISGFVVPKLRKSELAGAFLDGVNVASLALMAVVSWQLARAAVVDVPTALLAVASAVLLFRYRVNSAWLVLAGAGVGFVLMRSPS